ncbi:phage head closure protein [Pararhodobacter aggregans]|uniref:Head-tail adaptor protein n=1 Tax=Pararhodobacter aggregans TaxID=404875 RepID=A0A2T7UQU0_9RHOB|nr:phage head closure protein [Pararhodobacter aggregans]PTX01835.1 SPP1 family predicted phage head-tail adaptor [Pararhodobacter aggregans]PVE47032.1 head-tail adaptor protein [Pararhodobacter aggregans]
MRAGKMRHVIELQSVATVINPAGTPVETWSAVGTFRAEVVQQDAREFLKAQGAVGEVAAVFRIRGLVTVELAWRVKFRGEIYNIREIGGLDRQTGLELRCTRIEEGS